MQLRPSLLCSSVLSLLPFAAAQSPSPAADTRAEVGQAELRYTLGGTTVRRWAQGGVAHAAASRDGGASWFALQQPGLQGQLRQCPNAQRCRASSRGKHAGGHKVQAGARQQAR